MGVRVRPGVRQRLPSAAVFIVPCSLALRLSRWTLLSCPFSSSTRTTAIRSVIFELGLRKDWETSLLPHIVEKVRDAMGFEMHIPLDIVEV